MIAVCNNMDETYKQSVIYPVYLKSEIMQRKFMMLDRGLDRGSF